jgi:uncharacterized protein GlcG (DUF336 family)
MPQTTRVAAPRHFHVAHRRRDRGVERGGAGVLRFSEEVLTRMMTLELARKVIAAAEKKAGKIGQPMNIAVVDEGANLVAHVRMDGAWIGSIDISINKAFTSRAFDIATKDLAEHSQSGGQFFGIHVSNHGRVMIFAG